MNFCRSGITYSSTKDGKWRVSQKLNSISPYSISGNINNVIAFFSQKKSELEEDYGTPIEVLGNYFLEIDWDRGPYYVEPSKKITVCFDSFELKWNENVFEVWGSRYATEAELKTIEEQIKIDEERKKIREAEEYERLKKKFEKGEK